MADQVRLQVRKNNTENTWEDVGNASGNERLPVSIYGVSITGGKLDVNATASLAGETLPVSGATEGVGVAILDGSGNQITSFGGGTQYTEGDTDATITGTAALVEGAANALAVLTQPLTDTQLRAADVKITLDGESVPVTGTFWQATQPVSGTVTATATDLDIRNLEASQDNVAIGDGTNTGNILKSDGTAAGQNAVMVSGTTLSVSYTTTTAQAVGTTDARNYKSVSVHNVTNGGSSVANFQGSNNNTNWVAVPLLDASTNLVQTATSLNAASRIFYGNLGYRYFRLNITGIASGTTAGVIVFSTLPSTPHSMGVSISGAVTIASGGVASGAIASGAIAAGAIAAGATSIATTEDTASAAADHLVKVAAIRLDTPVANDNVNASGDYTQFKLDNFGKLWIAGSVPEDTAHIDAESILRNGVRRIDTAATSAGTSGDWATMDSSAEGAIWTTLTPTTTSGLSTAMFSGSDGSSILVATAQVIKASAGNLYGYFLYNPEAAVTFVHFYNTAAASVTVGTTNPLFTIPIPAGSAANLTYPYPVSFSNAGWSIAATTTAGGNTAPATGVSAVVWYK